MLLQTCETPTGGPDPRSPSPQVANLSFSPNAMLLNPALLKPAMLKPNDYWMIGIVSLAIIVSGCIQEPEKQPVTTRVEPLPEDPAVATPPTDEPTNDTSAERQAVISIDEILPTIAWQDAEKFIGEEVFLVGKVSSAGKDPKRGHYFLNFGDREEDVTGFIHSSVGKQFETPPNKTFQDKKVKIRGHLYRYDGQPNIRINAPESVTILPDNASLPEMVNVTEKPNHKIGDVITVASFNVLNMFDAEDDPYRGDEGTKIKSRKQMQALADCIRSINADVLALSEVENRGYLENFNKAMLRDLGYQHVVLIEGNDARGIDVALLSRLPVGPVTTYQHLTFPDANGQPMKMRRDLLHARIQPVDGQPFDVLAVHLKSRFGANLGESIRLGEGRMIRKVLDDLLEQNPDASFVLCGDFNDTLDSTTMQEVVGSGDQALTIFIDDLPADSRVTYNREPYLSMIDFIFASPAMAKRYVKDSYQIMPGSIPETGSDHNAVYARFRIK